MYITSLYSLLLLHWPSVTWTWPCGVWGVNRVATPYKYMLAAACDRNIVLNVAAKRGGKRLDNGRIIPISPESVGNNVQSWGQWENDFPWVILTPPVSRHSSCCSWSVSYKTWKYYEGSKCWCGLIKISGPCPPVWPSSDQDGWWCCCGNDGLYPPPDTNQK